MQYVNVYIHNLGRLWSHIEQHVMGFLSNKIYYQGGLRYCWNLKKNKYNFYKLYKFKIEGTFVTRILKALNSCRSK